MGPGSDLDPLDLMPSVAGDMPADMAMVPTLAAKDPKMAQFLGVAQQLPEKAQQSAELQRHMELMMDRSGVYSGMPLRVRGRVVATFCCVLHGLPADGEVPLAMRTAQEAAAGRLAAVLEDLC